MPLFYETMLVSYLDNDDGSDVPIITVEMKGRLQLGVTGSSEPQRWAIWARAQDVAQLEAGLGYK